MHELLSDRAGALHVAVAAQVVQRRAHEPDRVEPRVAEEAAVLDREHRLHQWSGQLLVAHAAALLAVLAVEVGDELGLERLLEHAPLRRGCGCRFTRVTFSLSVANETTSGSLAPSGTGRGKSVTPASDTANCPARVGTWRSA